MKTLLQMNVGTSNLNLEQLKIQFSTGISSTSDIKFVCHDSASRHQSADKVRTQEGIFVVHHTLFMCLVVYTCTLCIIPHSCVQLCINCESYSIDVFSFVYIVHHTPFTCSVVYTLCIILH